MLSWQARLTKIVLRAAKRGLARRNTAAPDQIAAMRRLLEAGAARNVRAPAGVRIDVLQNGPVAGEWIRVAGGAQDRAILYAHGGAYVACRPVTHRTLTVALARATGVAVFASDYRRAPEHRYPAALEDMLAAYDMLRASGISQAGIALAGDSAGGGLALATALALRARGLEDPVSGVAVYSPWTDLLGTGTSVYENAQCDDMLLATNGPTLARAYAEESQLADPFVSPLYGEYAGFPPLVVFVGSTEVLRDDALRLADRARAAGVDVTLHVEPELPHVWPVFDYLPEAKRSVAQTAEFLARRWSGQARPAVARRAPPAGASRASGTRAARELCVRTDEPTLRGGARTGQR